jgi:hypothetical protein
MVQKLSVHTCQTGQTKWHCTPNIYPGYQWFWKGQFAHVKHAKWNVIVLQTYTYILMVHKSLVCTSQTCQIKCYGTQNIQSIYQWFRNHQFAHCNQNIYPVYQWVWKGQFAHVKHAKWNVIALWTYILYTNGSEIVGSHMSNMPNKMILHFKHITYIPMVQNCQFAHVKQAK